MTSFLPASKQGANNLECRRSRTASAVSGGCVAAQEVATCKREGRYCSFPCSFCLFANFFTSPARHDLTVCSLICSRKVLAPRPSFVQVPQCDKIIPNVSIYTLLSASLFSPPACQRHPPLEARAAALGIRSRHRCHHASHEQLRRGHIPSNYNPVREWPSIFRIPPQARRIPRPDGELELARKVLGKNKLHFQCRWHHIREWIRPSLSNRRLRRESRLYWTRHPTRNTRRVHTLDAARADVLRYLHGGWLQPSHGDHLQQLDQQWHVFEQCNVEHTS
jgi:hypothetical protein